MTRIGALIILICATTIAHAVDFRLVRAITAPTNRVDIFVGQKIDNYIVTETNATGCLLRDGTNSLRLNRGATEYAPEYLLIRLDTGAQYKWRAGETKNIDGNLFKLIALNTNSLLLVNEISGQENMASRLTEKESKLLRTTRLRVPLPADGSRSPHR